MSKNRKILIFENTHNLSNHLLKTWVEFGSQAISRHNRFDVALSGGQTPIEFYCKLSNFDQNDLWMLTHVYWADERFVEHNSSQSNFRSVQQNLLNYVPIPPANIHPVQTDLETVELAADNYKKEILKTLPMDATGLPEFDLILLGIGEDGHTASLFPNQEGIDVKNQLTVPVSAHQLKNERISLSLSVINNARNVVFLVQGRKKADIVKQIIEEVNDLPAGRVRPMDGQLYFFLDKEAARHLNYLEDYTHVGDAIQIGQ